MEHTLEHLNPVSGYLTCFDLGIGSCRLTLACAEALMVG